MSAMAYKGSFDAASGTGKDKAAAAIAHVEGDRAVLDVIRAWAPPFNPSGVIAEAADLFKAYGIYEVVGDSYAPGFVLEAFSANGLRYVFSEKDRSQIYLETLPLVNAGRVSLLDHAELLPELRGLERRRGTSGRDRVDHPNNGHDDLAVAACGALTLVMQPSRDLVFIGGEYVANLTVEQQQADLEQETAARVAESSRDIATAISQKGVWGFPDY